MAYVDVEDALAARLNSIEGFSTAAGTGNVSKDDFRILGRGLGSAIIIGYDGFEQRRVSDNGEHEIDWRFVLRLLVRTQDEFSGSQAAGIARQLIIDKINAYPKLGTSIVFDALVNTGEEIPEDIEMGGIRYVLEVLRCIATEELSVSYEE